MDLPAIDLGELDRDTSLLQRVERKYVVPRDVIDDVLSELAPTLQVLELSGRRHFEYRSLYFDTPDLLSYRLSLHGHRRRFKVRSRLYADEGSASLEVKLKDGRGMTVKHRRPHSTEALRILPADTVAWIDGLIASRAVAASSAAFVPTVITAYTRQTLVEGATARVTLDHRFAVSCAGEEPRSLGDAVIVETKSPGTATMTDRLLWRRGVRPLRISKFGIAMAVCHPDLLANRWHRALERHFGR